MTDVGFGNFIERAFQLALLKVQRIICDWRARRKVVTYEPRKARED